MMSSDSGISSTRKGIQVARMVLKRSGLEGQLPINVTEIAARDGIHIADSDFANPESVALLMHSEHATAILVAKNLDRRSRSFAIAHALGHFHIPTHQRLTCRPCDASAMKANTPQRAPHLEVEANQFATELIMPFRQFAADTDRLELSLLTAHRLAAEDKYDVFVMTAVERMLDTTSQAGLLVMSEEGVVVWSQASKHWTLGWPSRGTPLLPDSVAAAVFRGESASGGAEHVDRLAWFEQEPADEITLLESALPIPRTRLVMSLLWTPDSD